MSDVPQWIFDNQLIQKATESPGCISINGKTSEGQDLCLILAVGKNAEGLRQAVGHIIPGVLVK